MDATGDINIDCRLHCTYNDTKNCYHEYDEKTKRLRFDKGNDWIGHTMGLEAQAFGHKRNPLCSLLTSRENVKDTHTIYERYLCSLASSVSAQNKDLPTSKGASEYVRTHPVRKPRAEAKQASTSRIRFFFFFFFC